MTVLALAGGERRAGARRRRGRGRCQVRSEKQAGGAEEAVAQRFDVCEMGCKRISSSP